jgi:hypothetical protein
VSTIAYSEHVSAPPGATFAAFADFPNAAGRVPGILKIEMLTSGPVKVGTQFKETRKMLGKVSTETMEVTGFEPPRRYVLSANSCGVAFASEFRFLAEKGGTRVDFTMTITPLTFFAKLLSPLTWLLKGTLMKALKRDIAAIKAHVESQPATA